MRRNTRALRAQTCLQVTSAFSDTWNDLGQDPDAVQLMLSALDGFDHLDRINKARARFFMMAYNRNDENAFFLHKIGILEEADWKGISVDMKGIYSYPGAHAIWKLVRDRTSAEFHTCVDQLIAANKAARTGS